MQKHSTAFISGLMLAAMLLWMVQPTKGNEISGNDCYMWHVVETNRPTITATAVADPYICMPFPTPTNGLSVTASAKTSCTIGTKYKLEHGSNYVTDPLPIGVDNHLSTWTAVGCGAYPSNGFGTTASFKVFSCGPCGVTFDVVGSTVCPGDLYPAGASTNISLVQISHECVATTPTNRIRTTIGVREEVKLDVCGAPGTNVTWTVDNKGELSTTNGTETYLTAPEIPTNCTVIAYFDGGSCERGFGVQKPSGVKFTKIGEKHNNGLCDAGFLADVIILNTNVSFYNIEISELTCLSSATGCYSDAGWNNMPHSPWPAWLTPAEDNHLYGYGAADNVYSGAISPPFSSGVFTWNIPWNYRRHGGTNDGYNFTTLTHQATASSTGHCEMSKNGINAGFDPSDPSVNW